MNYGVGTQKKMAEFSEKAIDNVRTKDMGEVGDMISTLVTQLKDFDVEEEQKGLRALFKKSANRVTALKAKYSKVETNVVTITDELEKHQIQLMKDVDILDRMYALNLNYYKELTMYIIAGKKKLELLRNSELVRLQQKARLSGLPEDAQAVKDMAAQCDRFEKKIYDLELTRTIAMGLQCFEPYGAFYVFPCIKQFGMTSEEFATRLLKEEKLAVVPGTAFGDSGEGYIRISYAYSLEDLKKAIGRLKEFIAGLQK